MNAKPVLKIIYADPALLRPRERNARTHSDKQISQIANSIKEFGFVNPVLVDGKNGIIAGHGRVCAAKKLGMTDIPTVCVNHLTPAQVRAYVIADNKLAENAGWDRQLLAIELQEISNEFDFDITVTGFELPELDILLGELEQTSLDNEDSVPEMDRSSPAVSAPGDLWKIGNHAVLCGDALNKGSYERLLGDQKAQLVFMDPPYNVRVSGHVSGKGKIKHREFAMASGEMSQKEFTKFLETTFEHSSAFSVNGSIHYVCMDWRHIRETLNASEPHLDLKNLCIWTKTNAGMGSLYRSQHELIFVFKNGKAHHINNVELGRFGRSRSNVWPYGGTNSFSASREEDLAMHPTVKPMGLVADAILDCSRRGGAVLDPFAGSGTTLIAAEKTGRQGYGLEIDPYFVDTIIRRFKSVYGLEAIHGETGKQFEQVRADRLGAQKHRKEKKKTGSPLKERELLKTKKVA